MKSNLKLISIISLLLTGNFFSYALPQKENDKKSNDQYFIAAYIWPSCHHDERFGNMLWPEGIDEWEVIKKLPSMLETNG